MFKRYVYIEGLTNLIDSKGEFYINILGNVKDRFGENISTELDSDGNITVKVLSWDGRRDYRVIDLVAIHFKDLHIPKEKYNDVIAFTLDSDKKNIHASNIGYRFKEKIEAKDFSGFYHVPAFTKIALNELGEVINVKTKNKLKWGITKPGIKNTKGGYFIVKYSLYDSQQSSCLRHRALCLIFKDYPDNVDLMTVNHKNGIPGEDWLDNLEWATRSENNIHAYVNDLKNQHMRVLCRDVLTGDVIEYYSISECSRVLGYSTDETIRYRLYQSVFSTVFSDGKQFKLKSDERDWIIPDDPKKAIEEGQLKTAVIVRDCKTLFEMSYDTVIDASKAIGIKRGSIHWRLERGNKKPLFGYQVKNLNDSEPFPDFTQEDYITSLNSNSFPVSVRNLLTNEIREYDSINQVIQELGHTHMASVLREGRQPLYSDGWQVKFQNESWEDIPDFEEEIYKRTRDITAKCEKTGDLILAENAQQMSEILGRDVKAIRVAAMTRGNKVYHGYRFRLGVSDETWPI